jgi:HK97 family phage major capsid protein
MSHEDHYAAIFESDNPQKARTDAMRNELAELDEEAGKRWKEFKDAQEKVKAEGGDWSDDAVFEPVHRKSKAYAEVAEKAGKLRKDLMAILESQVSGGNFPDTKAPVPGGWPTSISDAFLKNVDLDAVKALTAGGTLAPPFFDPALRILPQRKLFVRSVIPTQPTTGEEYWYLRQTVFTNQAAPVAAGAIKPVSTITVERVEDSVRTIAHTTEALDRALLADQDQLRPFLDGMLRLGVLLAEENQILNGNGTPPNLRGILQTAGILTQATGADPRVDAIQKGITKLRNQASPYEPNAVVLHPNDWQDIVLQKDAAGNYQAADSGAVLTAGDAGGIDRIWNKEVIVSMAIAEGTALVGDFNQCQIYDREEARVTFTESGLGNAAGEEMFTRNQVRFRGEERIGFGVFRPAAFCTVTGL